MACENGGEIVSRGKVVQVTGDQLEEIRKSGMSWFKYSQARLTNYHRDVISQHFEIQRNFRR